MLSDFSTIDEAKKAMEESYADCHESVADFAEELTTDTTEIPESLAFYIDYEKMGHDLYHVEVRSIKPGLKEYGNGVGYVRAFLEHEAKSKQWEKKEEAMRQYQLF